jgi:hypothetical protein
MARPAEQRQRIFEVEVCFGVHLKPEAPSTSKALLEENRSKELAILQRVLELAREEQPAFEPLQNAKIERIKISVLLEMNTDQKEFDKYVSLWEPIGIW